MNDILSALVVVPSEHNDDGVLNTILLNARRLLYSGLITSTLFIPIVRNNYDECTLESESLVELVLHSEEIENEHVGVLSNRLSEFLFLKPGWNNDESSKSIDPSSVELIKRAISLSDPLIWQRWLVFPEPCGSVVLDYESEICRASISVGKDGFSFMAYGRGFLDTAERQELSELELLSFLRKVKEYELG